MFYLTDRVGDLVIRVGCQDKLRRVSFHMKERNREAFER